MRDYKAADSIAETNSNPEKKNEKERGALHIWITLSDSDNKTKNSSFDQKQNTVEGMKDSKYKRPANIESKIASKKPRVITGRIKGTNDTNIKNIDVVQNKVKKVLNRVKKIPKPPMKKMNRNIKNLAKPGKIAKPKEKEHPKDNKKDIKKSDSEKKNYKQGKFLVQILENKIKGKIQSIKEKLAARNHTGSKQNLTTTTMSTSLPKSSRPQTIPEVTSSSIFV